MAGSALLAALPGIALLLLLHLTVLIGSPDVMVGQLIDTDSFQRMVRLRDAIARGFDWAGGIVARENPPGGIYMHWTRLYDAFILLIAAPLAIFRGWQEAILVAGPVSGGLAYVLLALAGLWAARAAGGAAAIAVAAVAYAASPMALGYGAPGRVDHHALVAAFWILSLGAALRAIKQPGTHGWGVLAGTSLAATFWVQPEALIVASVSASFLIIGGLDRAERKPAAVIGFAWSFPATMLLAFVIDPPGPGRWLPFPDRLSIVYVTYAMLVGAIAAGSAWLGTQKRALPARTLLLRRISVLAGPGAAAAALWIWLFPGLANPDLYVFTPDLLWMWAYVQEMKSPLTLPLSAAFNRLGPSVVGMLAAAFLIWRATRSRRWRVACLASLALVALAMHLMHIRWSVYAHALAPIMLGLAVEQVGGFVRRISPTDRAHPRALLAMAVLTFLAISAPSRIGEAFGDPANPSNNPTETGEIETAAICSVRSIAPFLKATDGLGASVQRIATEINYAPQIMWWTPHEVLAGPYHMNIEGLTDLNAILLSPSDELAEATARRRNLSLIMLCKSHKLTLYARNGASESLYHRLHRGEAPDWLEPLEWPEGVESGFALYRIRPPGT